ncbi:ParA family protein [Myroides odoratimimus]|uniref:ParA family protein n=1 Tax=Myroides odoratimimus TaxID=76832 RepID=UPI0025750C23|nr:ParA family protein [Myroides odoratimimus]MDM1399007.1 ParA family protein [Myroides odoratimimus]
MRILVTHQKGGVGKSTIAVALANYFLSEGIIPALVDMDAQGSISSFRKIYENNGIDVHSNLSLEQINALPNEVIIIDTPPYLYDGVDNFKDSVNFVVVPLKPNLYDVGAVGGTIQLLRDNNLIHKSFVLLNQVRNGEAIEIENQEAIKELEKFNVNLLESRFNYSVQLKRISEGQYEPKARQQVEAVIAEIINILK